MRLRPYVQTAVTLLQDRVSPCGSHGDSRVWPSTVVMGHVDIMTANVAAAAHIVKNVVP